MKRASGMNPSFRAIASRMEATTRSLWARASPSGTSDDESDVNGACIGRDETSRFATGCEVARPRRLC
jgi:hypothetical protein